MEQTSSATVAGSADLGLSVKRLDVIVKVAERCNIACRYCYYFNDAVNNPLTQPALMSYDTWGELIAFLKTGVREVGVEDLKIIFHGGEPTLVSKKTIGLMCQMAIDELAADVSLEFSLQTNATLLSPAWISLIKKFQIAVGVSLDGPKEYNDKNRLDHRGRSTYEATRSGISLLMAGADRGTLTRPGALFVVDPDTDPKLIFEHLVKELGFEAFDALLPDHNEALDTSRYGKFLCGLFDAWVEHGNEKIYVRTFRSFFDRLAGRGSYQFPLDPEKDDFLAISVTSSGRLRPDDIVSDIRWGDASIQSMSLAEFTKHPFYTDWRRDASKIPEECSDCCWSGFCRGGHPTHRFKNDGRSFDRKSSYCGALQELYAHISAFMLENGYPLKRLVEQMDIDKTTVRDYSSNV